MLAAETLSADTEGVALALPPAVWAVSFAPEVPEDPEVAIETITVDCDEVNRPLAEEAVLADEEEV